MWSCLLFSGCTVSSLRPTGFSIVAHGLRCPTTCGILVSWPGQPIFCIGRWYSEPPDHRAVPYICISNKSPGRVWCCWFGALHFEYHWLKQRVSSRFLFFFFCNSVLRGLRSWRFLSSSFSCLQMIQLDHFNSTDISWVSTVIDPWCNKQRRESEMTNSRYTALGRPLSAGGSMGWKCHLQSKINRMTVITARQVCRWNLWTQCITGPSPSGLQLGWGTISCCSWRLTRLLHHD